MGNKQSSEASRRRSTGSTGRPPARRENRAKARSNPRRATVAGSTPARTTASQPVSPQQPAGPVLPASVSAPVTPAPVSPAPLLEAFGFNNVLEAASATLPVADLPTGQSDPDMSSEEKERMVLERQFAILLQIQHDIAKASRDKMDRGASPSSAGLIEGTEDDGERADSPSGPSESPYTKPKTVGAVVDALSPADLHTDAAERVCSICLEDLDPSSGAAVTALLCYHVYHVTCINNWRAKGSQECPMCGADTV